ncbi:hypothetical protein Tco_0664695 [Tanacetum coccineum]
MTGGLYENTRRQFSSNEDFTKKISHSVFVTNFPDYVNSRDLWNKCSVYGTIGEEFLHDMDWELSFVCKSGLDEGGVLWKGISLIVLWGESSPLISSNKVTIPSRDEGLCMFTKCWNIEDSYEGVPIGLEDEEVAETDFMEKSSQSMEHSVHVDKEISADPFGLNDLLGLKKPVEENLEPSPSLSHPPGFSPVGSLNSSDKELN